jgi:iron complex transport system permease protein
MPRILMAGLVGAALSVVGATFQSTFKNPLADPHILGISSGAAVGATIAMFTGISLNIFGFGIIGIFAFVGALITAVVVYQLACIGNKVSSINVILTGTAISTLLSSVISLMMVFHHEKIEKVYMWTLGSFSSATWVKTGFAAVFIFVFVIGVFIYAKELDMMITGNETAQSLGVDTGKIRKILIVFSTVLIATCVAVSGIIGFVGLIIPHCVRILSGPKHKNLLPFSCFGGAIFMIISDTLGRTLAAPSEIPVGVITAFLGTPYFIFLLQKSKKKLEGK